MVSLAQISSGAIQCSFYTKFRRSSGSFWCRYPVRFRKGPVKMLGEVPVMCGADTWWRYLLRFRRVLVQVRFPRVLVKILGEVTEGCRYLLTFGRVPVKMLGEVPEAFGLDIWWRCLVRFRRVPDTWWGSGRFRCRYLAMFRRVPVKMLGDVPEASGGDTWWRYLKGFGGFRYRYLVGFRGGSGEDTWRGFGRFRCRYLMTFRRVPVKMLGRVPVGSDDDGGWGFGRFSHDRSVKRTLKLSSCWGKRRSLFLPWFLLGVGKCPFLGFWTISSAYWRWYPQ